MYCVREQKINRVIFHFNNFYWSYPDESRYIQPHTTLVYLKKKTITILDFINNDTI
jgi:hypothetical protein